MGIGKPIFASSGNGYHLILRADIDNEVDNVGIVKNFLKVLDEHRTFSDFFAALSP